VIGPLAPKLALARAVGALSRLRGGEATSAPGKALLRLDPHAIGTLGARLGRGSALISATNGKTTTAAMVASILAQDGVELLHNHAGANMAGGIASTLLAAAGPRGTIAGELGLFEVDELWLAQLIGELHPRAILLGNLFRDQLDRYGELETIAERWGQAVRESPGREARLVLNADDPLVADLGRAMREQPVSGSDPDQSPIPGPDLDQPDQPAGPRRHPGGPPANVLYFGVDDDSLALPELAHAADAKHCRNCGTAYVFEAIYLGHLGHYRCPACGQARPSGRELSVIATDVRLEGVRAASFTLHTPTGEGRVQLALPGLYNVYNALAAAALATALEVAPASILAGLGSTRAVFGRAESVTLEIPADPARRRELRILLIKNPAGANEVLRTLALEPGEHDLLGALNDNIADGRDVSWIWDADFELLAGRVRRVTCSGTRAEELALRLKYAGIAPPRIRVQPDLHDALEEAIADRRQPDRGLATGAATTDHGIVAVDDQPVTDRSTVQAGPADEAPLYALPTYTAMLSLRELLAARSGTGSALS
jgi:lipid II isoglutaminyl synthase (glutamine-hydrolysing)